MSARRLFGTDGIRGVANRHPMTTDVAMNLGRALAHNLKRLNRRPKVVVGKDTRLSGYMIETALSSGLCSAGADVHLVGPLPTPGIAFITNSMRADAGVVISASHNPFQDNGIKIFQGDGFKLDDDLEAGIETDLIADDQQKAAVTAEAVGKAFRIDDATGRYVVFLKQAFPRELSLDGLKIGIDCAHGAAYKAAPAVLTELGAEVTAIGIKPNGVNINNRCGSTHPGQMTQVVKNRKLDLGVCLDGDGDRAIFIDDAGRIIDGDHVLALCAQDMLERDQLKRRTVAATVMSNLGLEIALQRMKARLIRTKVGDRYVVEEMRNRGLNLGGEQSGHTIFLDHNTTGDGILSALMVLGVMARTGRSLADLSDVMEKYPQVLVNVKVASKPPLSELPLLSKAIDQAEKDMAGAGRVLIRYSGTEAKIRIMIEGENEDRIKTLAEELAETAKNEIG